MPTRANTFAVASLLATTLAACDEGALPGPPLGDGVYVVEGSAELATGLADEPTTTAFTRLVVFVEDGIPQYVREETYGDGHGRIYDLRFEGDAELSDPVDLNPATGHCMMQMRRDGCALFSFDGCLPIDPRTDTGFTLTGDWMACPTQETFVPRLEVVGAITPDAIHPEGAARLSANYRLDPSLDAIEARVDGEVRELSWTPDADPDTATFSLGSVPPNAELVITHVGTRSVSFAHAEGFETSAVADLTFDTLVPGSVDARGEPVTLVDGALEVRRMTSPPNPAFAYAVALGEPPPDASRLVVTLASRSFGETRCEQTLVRADGTLFKTFGDVLDLPEGSGATWLVVECGATYAPNGGAFGSTLRLEGVVWE